MKNYDYYSIKEFIIYVEAINDEITKVKCVSKIMDANPSDTTEQCKAQLDEYFTGKRQSFDIKYKLDALPFRSKLYSLIQAIEYGKTTGAKQLLEQMGLNKGVSVILRATFDNPLQIIIPCHRVINPLRRVRAYNYDKNFREFLLSVEREG